ncbi:glucokinase [Oleiagrimonas sp. C23AA]|nr:glucokinase [Oleiagrimonas sp. C23AA]
MRTATPFIAADVGGTHARLGLVRGQAHAGGGEVSVLEYAKYPCADYTDLADIVRRFIDEKVGAPVTHCALACAGYAVDGEVINTNLPWPVNLEALRQATGLDSLSLINDFEAVAYATRFIDPARTSLISQCEQGDIDGPVIVVGPGTGLGSAVCIPRPDGPMVLATEAGQINLAPVTACERELLEAMADGEHYVSYERVLSGPGLLAVYRALAVQAGTTPALTAPEQVTEAALAGDDACARQALDTFCGLLGSFVGNLAMLYGARGGVFLAGGIVPQIRHFLQRSAFVERFLDKGDMRAFLERVPVRVMEHGQLGVIGAAGWHLEHSR